MQELVRCKVCGYIMDAGKVGDLCPACGVSSKVFEPYKSNISQMRRKILELHIHPIILHFPQAFVVFGAVLLLLILVFGDVLRTNLMVTTKITFISLPFFVAGGFASGLLDGKIRFKKLTTPVLKQKILLGIVFQILSIITALIVGLTNLGTAELIVSFILTAVSCLCAVALGRIGGFLLESRMPG